MKILFIDKVHSSLEENLTKHGYQCIDGTELNKNQILKIISDINGIIIRSRIKIDSFFLKKCKSLKFIGRYGSGLESIDVECAKNLNIRCINTPEGNANAVAEHSLGMILNLLNNINKSNSEIRRNIWNRKNNTGSELSNKVIGIIGYGNCGKAFAKILKGFGCTILAYDKYVSEYKEKWVKKVSLKDIYENANVLSLHIPLNEETHYFINEKIINNFKNPFYLINTSRGKCVNTSSIINGIKNKKIIGACLDVFEEEKESFNKLNKKESVNMTILKNLKNVVLTPHIAGLTIESYKKNSQIMFKKIHSLANY